MCPVVWWDLRGRVTLSCFPGPAKLPAADICRRRREGAKGPPSTPWPAARGQLPVAGGIFDRGWHLADLVFLDGHSS